MDSLDTFNSRLTVIKQKLRDLYEPDDIAMWLITPQARFNQRQPADLLWSEEGYRELSTIIQQLLDGAFI